jgi:hypothetical protein
MVAAGVCVFRYNSAAEALLVRLPSNLDFEAKRHFSWFSGLRGVKATFSMDKGDVFHSFGTAKATVSSVLKRRFPWSKSAQSDISHGVKATLC